MARGIAWLTQEHWLVGASLMRVALGVWAVYFYLLHAAVRHDLWAPDGLLPFEKFLETGPTLNVFQWSRSSIYFEAVYVAAMVVAVLVTLGYRSRVVIPLHWLMIWSFQERNPLLGDGGDNIMRIVLLFLGLVNTGACLSLDALRLAPHPPGRLGWRGRVHTVHEWVTPVLVVVHNFGALLILAQLSMLYMSTGLYKAMGELWQTGTALYYILRVDEFSWPGIAEVIYRNPYLVVLGTYGTVLFEVMFFPSLFNRWTRYATIMAGVVFHSSIALVMGLVTFAWSMLSIYPLLVTDEEYAMIGTWVRRRWALTAFYDGWCPACTRSVRWLGRFDLFSLVEFLSFREPGVVDRYRLDPRRVGRRIHSTDAGGRVREGIDAMAAIAGRSVILWPLVPLFWLARLIAGQRLYDAFASRRTILIPGVCEDHCEIGQEPAMGARASPGSSP